MNNDILRYTLRTDRDLFAKFRYVAESEGRSANKELIQLMKKHIADFESKNGTIDLEEI